MELNDGTIIVSFDFLNLCCYSIDHFLNNLNLNLFIYYFYLIKIIITLFISFKTGNFMSLSLT